MIFISTLETFSQVQQEWVRRFNGQNNSEDQGLVVTLDKFSRIYVAGRSGDDIIIICYNSLGDVLWSTGFSGYEFTEDWPADLKCDRYGNLYLAGTTTQRHGATNSLDIVTLKYSPTGALKWLKLYDFEQAIRDDEAKACMLNFTGTELYIAGNSNSNCFILPYHADNGYQEVFYYYGDTTGNDGFNDIVTDAVGNVYVTGWIEVLRDGRNYEYVTMKLDNMLNPVWMQTYNGTGQSIDIAYAMAIDNNLNNLYVTGSSYATAGGNNDFATVSYDLDGSQRWVKRYNGPGDGSDFGRDIIMDNSNNAIVTGRSDRGNGNSDITTIKYDRTGEVLWVSRFEIDGGFYDDGMSIACDSLDNVYVAGSLGYVTGSEAVLIKYNSNGIMQWYQKYDAGHANSVSLDKRNNVYINGHTKLNTYHEDMLTIKYNQSGKIILPFTKNNVNKPINDNSITRDTVATGQYDLESGTISNVEIQIDTILHTNDDDLEITLTHNGITDTLIYRAGGSGDNFLGTFLQDGIANNISSGTAPFTNDYKPFKPLSAFNNQQPGGNWILSIYDRATGNTGVLKAWTLLVTTQYPFGIRPVSTEIPKTNYLSQNYPNPFNPTTKIKFDITDAESGHNQSIQLKIYDILGHEVTTLVNEQLKPGGYEVEFNGSNFASGVYYCRLQAGDYSATKKMLMIK